jgi:hypothetical protein
MIQTTGTNLQVIPVLHDKRHYGQYVSDTIDLQAIGHLPTVVLTNQNSGSGFAQIERSVDGVNWGKSLVQGAYSTIAGNATVFLQDQIPIAVRYMRIVFWLEHFPDTMNIELSLL